MRTEKGKIIKKIFLTCFWIILFVCFLYNFLYQLNTMVFQKDYLQLFGISLFNMKTNQMRDDIKYGDLIVIKKADIQDLQIGDIIAYSVNGKTRINKIINKSNNNTYTTKSNQNYYPDIEKIEYSQIIGKMETNKSGLGFFIGILQSKITSLCTIIFLLLTFLYNNYLFAKKQERIKKKNG